MGSIEIRPRMFVQPFTDGMARRLNGYQLRHLITKHRQQAPMLTAAFESGTSYFPDPAVPTVNKPNLFRLGDKITANDEAWGAFRILQQVYNLAIEAHVNDGWFSICARLKTLEALNISHKNWKTATEIGLHKRSRYDDATSLPTVVVGTITATPTVTFDEAKAMVDIIAERRSVVNAAINLANGVDLDFQVPEYLAV